MDKNKYEPVSHDHETFLQKAMKRTAFRQAYEELTEEYTLVRELLAARIKAGLMGGME